MEKIIIIIVTITTTIIIIFIIIIVIIIIIIFIIIIIIIIITAAWCPSDYCSQLTIRRSWGRSSKIRLFSESSFTVLIVFMQ